MEHYLLRNFSHCMYPALPTVSSGSISWCTPSITNEGKGSMPEEKVSFVPELSINGRLHVFRRYFAAPGEFDSMEVDAYVVASKRYLIVCDTLLSPEDMAQVMEEVSGELHGRQLLVFNSHADWDHCWGNSYFSGSNAAPIIAHQHSVTRLRSVDARERLEYYQPRYPQFEHVVLTEPTITFTDGLTIHGGDLEMRLLHTPGHHADHSAMWIPEMSLL